MYETKINIFTKGLKKYSSELFFCIFYFFFYKICKKLIFENGYTYKFDNVLIDSLILSKSVWEYHSFISLHKEKTSQTVHLDFYFLMLKKVLNLLKKKDTATILLQSTPQSIKMRALICRLCWLVVEIFGPLFWACLFFWTNYFKVKLNFFQKSKKNISTHFFYEKMVSVLFFFL